MKYISAIAVTLVLAIAAQAALPSSVKITKVTVQRVGAGTYSVTVEGTAQLATNDRYVGFKCDLRKPDGNLVSTFANFPIPTPGGPAVQWSATNGAVVDLGDWKAIASMAIQTGNPLQAATVADTVPFTVP
jgi:hypothetical protein